jgi:hypothetical protein
MQQAARREDEQLFHGLGINHPKSVNEARSRKGDRANIEISGTDNEGKDNGRSFRVNTGRG